MNQEAFQLAALSAAELVDYLRTTKGTTFSDGGSQTRQLHPIRTGEHALLGALVTFHE
ncbi:TPA: hypothetical protein ACGR77_000513 [Pseudomonas aeruginosa]